MSIDDIIEALVLVEEHRLPRAAIRAAVAQKEEITPVLIHELDMCLVEYREGTLMEDGSWLVPAVAATLLASFGEQAAHERLVALLSMDEEHLEWMWSDSITEDGARLLLSTYPGDPSLLQGLVENERAYDFARVEALKALYGAVKASMLEEAGFVGYLTGLFRGKLSRLPSYLWDEMVNVSAQMRLEHLEPDILKACEEGLCETIGDRDLEEVLHILHGRDPFPGWVADEVKLISDAELELSQWPFFNEKQTKVPKPVKPKTGRNDPCPCGSGKKYKKCCGGTAGGN